MPKQPQTPATLIKFIKSLKVAKPRTKVIKKVKPQPKLLSRHAPLVVHRYPAQLKQSLIRVYYGSSTDFSQPRYTMSALGKLFYMNTQTVSLYVNKFQQGGFRFDVFEKYKRPMFEMLSEEIKRDLVSPQLLQEWALYGIKARCSLIKQRFNVSISHSHLERFYRAMKVKFKVQKSVFR